MKISDIERRIEDINELLSAVNRHLRDREHLSSEQIRIHRKRKYKLKKSLTYFEQKLKDEKNKELLKKGG